jgi:hypothetical protein
MGPAPPNMFNKIQHVDAGAVAIRVAIAASLILFAIMEALITGLRDADGAFYPLRGFVGPTGQSTILSVLEALRHDLRLHTFNESFDAI